MSATSNGDLLRESQRREPRPYAGGRPDVAVLGAGILGSLTALRCALQGLSVVLIERESTTWSRASLHNEGKVHLGLVYALGGPATRRSLLVDALEFAPEIEHALGSSVDWPALLTPAFRYIVMPDSQLPVEELAKRYREVDDHYRAIGRPAYLGESLDGLVDLTPATDEQSGLPCFITAERAVDPIALRQLVNDRIEREDGIDVLLDATVLSVDPRVDDPKVEVEIVTAQERLTVRPRVIIDCRWEQQGADVAGRAPDARNIRVKAAVRLRSSAPLPTATLVAGPFGDLVQHSSYGYVSWYPSARLHHEYAHRPSEAALAALAQAESPDVIDAQLHALQRFGWLSGEIDVLEGVGGFIIGDGAHDIAHRESRLHDRAASGVEQVGSVVTPRSFKFSSAPSAARRAAEAAWATVNA